MDQPSRGFRSDCPFPADISETEVLVAYGDVCLASKAGQLAGNHVITLTSGIDNLETLGKKTLWDGAQDIVFEAHQLNSPNDQS